MIGLRNREFEPYLHNSFFRLYVVLHLTKSEFSSGHKFVKNRQSLTVCSLLTYKDAQYLIWKIWFISVWSLKPKTCVCLLTDFMLGQSTLIISYRGKWLYLFCLGCMYLTTSKYDLKLLMLLLINFRLSSKETFRYFTKSSGMKKSIDSVTVLFLKSNAKNPRNGYFLRKSVISASVMKTI